MESVATFARNTQAVVSTRKNRSLSEHTRLAQLEQRVQTLEDVNAIQHLKARYAAYCDDQYNPDALAALFTEDAVWESQGLGRFEGREAIREFFRGASQLFTFAIHYSLNGQIDVQGDTARAQWYLFMPCTLGADNRAMWRAGVDQEEYVRVAGEWKFTRKSSAPLFHTPFEEGWAKTRFI
jgi:ketosteroid isomerase-like protein